MSDHWYDETCPHCGARNWINNGDPDDGDCSKLDVTDYRCYGCEQDIRIVDGEHGDERRPHVLGLSPWDEFMQGAHVKGRAHPAIPTPTP